MRHYIGSNEDSAASKARHDARELEQADILLQLSLGRLSGKIRHSNRNGKKRSDMPAKRRCPQKIEQYERPASSHPSQQPSSTQQPRFQTKTVTTVCPSPEPPESPEPPSLVSLQLARLAESTKRTRESRRCVMTQCLARLAESMKRSGESRRCVMLQRELMFAPEQRRQLTGTKVELPLPRRQLEAVSPVKASKSQSPIRKSPKRGKESKRKASSIANPKEQGTRKKVAPLDKGKKSPASASGDDNIAKKIKLAKQFKTMTASLSGNKLLAAKIVPEFKIFLSTAERREVETLD